MTELPRLSTATVGRLDPGISVGTRPLGVGIVHLGIGAFHRAHQAVYTEEAMAAEGGGRWGICGVTQRSRAVVDQLAPQDGLYSVLERGDDGVAARVVGSVLEVIAAADSPDHLLDRLADPAVSVVTLTVTEKGYRRDATGGLDLADPAVRADLDGSTPPVTAIGQLVHGLRRRAVSEAPLTVLSCDNLVDNGSVVRGLVEDFCAALPSGVGEPLQAWIARSVSFPSSMIDRIVPATTDDDRAEAQRLLGVRDEGLVVAEPFRQWVIENAFAAAVPAWDKAGATITADVAPYEAVKLRLLNATHSLLAYAGALAGYDTIAAAVRDAKLAAAAAALMVEDVVPTLTRPDDLDLEEYQRSVLQRFANPALRHRTTQVAMDGSQKLPVRLLGTIRDRLRAGAEPRWAAFAVAAWMVYVARGRDANGRPLPLDDPMADRLRSAATGPESGLVDRLLLVEEIFDEELSDSATLRALLNDAAAQLLA